MPASTAIEPLQIERGAGARFGNIEMDRNLQEAMGCTCLCIRRAARQFTQIYDRALEPAGLTVMQFGLLARLFGASLRSEVSSIGAIAEWLGMDPTTLNRNLKPLRARGLVKDRSDPSDARLRIVQITEKGRRELNDAMALWRQAHMKVEQTLGRKQRLALNDALDQSMAKLEPLR
jgi:DNA-binding MarR family transcriptional regulator